jgi:hypothetical protein
MTPESVLTGAKNGREGFWVLSRSIARSGAREHARRTQRTPKTRGLLTNVTGQRPR